MSDTYEDHRHNLKTHIRERRDRAKINLGMTIVNYKMRKATSEVQAFFEGKPAKKKWFFARPAETGCCNFCAGPRR